jgi:hypothetical protein
MHWTHFVFVSTQMLCMPPLAVVWYKSAPCPNELGSRAEQRQLREQQEQAAEERLKAKFGGALPKKAGANALLARGQRKVN